MKIHQLLFYFLILLLPTQLGKHFWPNWSMVNGLRIDYLSPTLYLTDLLILGILGLWGVEKIFKFFKNYWCLSIFWLFLFLNVILAQNQPAALYKLAKILEFFLLGFYIVKNQFPISNIQPLISVAIVYSSLIAIFQFLKQGSIGGPFWFLGERTFNGETPGIAQAIIDGQLILRPYATFPHPNVLGGFLTVGLILILPVISSRFSVFSFQSLGFRLISFMACFLGIITLFLTFSRLAWFVFGLSLLVYGFWFAWLKRRAILKHWLILLLLIVIGSFLFPLTIPRLRVFVQIQPESLIIRQDLNMAAWEMVKKSPIIGVGLGNFLVRLPEFYQEKGQVRFLQPAHNIYLMIGAETGLVGLGLFLWFILLTFIKLLHYSITPLLIALISILILGFFDHYFYTLQQGQLLFVIVLGLCWSNRTKRINRSYQKT